MVAYVLTAQTIAFIILEPARNYGGQSFEGLFLAITIVTAPLAYLFAVSQRRLNQERKDRISDQDLDHLTGLLNRGAFLDAVRDALVERHTSTTYALAVINLDYFGELSELYGSRTGDRVLCHVASDLSNAIRESDLLCRLEGEEFCLLVTTAESEHLAAFTRRLIKVVNDHPYSADGSILDLTASCGYTMIQPQDTADDALTQARSALLAAKRGGGNCSRLFTQEPPTKFLQPTLNREVV